MILLLEANGKSISCLLESYREELTHTSSAGHTLSAASSASSTCLAGKLQDHVCHSLAIPLGHGTVLQADECLHWSVA